MRYRSTYTSRRDRRSGGGAGGFLMPFLILICIGVIIVLLFNLWKALYGEEDQVEAYMHIVEGSAKMQAWGTDGFINLSSDANVMTGDQVVASSDGKLIVEFFDGTIMRMDKNTDVLFEEINDLSDEPQLKILLLDGKIWFNKSYHDTRETQLTVSSNNMLVKSTGVSNFSVDNNPDEAARVFYGSDIEINILNEDGTSVDTESLGVGQEIVLTDEVLDKYWQYQSPNVIEAISEEFERSTWYLWNISEDKSPTKFQKNGEGGAEFVEVEPVLMETTTSEEEDEENLEDGEEEDEENLEEENEEENEEEDPEPSGSLAKPQLTSAGGTTSANADGFYVTTSSKGVITGTVSGADSVQVNGYTLSKFSPGDTTWTYYANASYGLMQPGENTYNVVAFDSDGNKSDTLVVKVYYDPPQAPAPTPDPEPTTDPEPEETPESDPEPAPETTSEPEPTPEPEPEIQPETTTSDDSSPPADPPSDDSGGGEAVL